MDVYRIEHPDDNHGPYRSSHRANTAAWMATAEEDGVHPLPWEDDIDWPDEKTEDWLCGFTSIVMFQSWFNDTALRQAMEQGFVLAVYWSTSVRVGQRQCIFHKQSSRLRQFNLEDVRQWPINN